MRPTGASTLTSVTKKRSAKALAQRHDRAYAEFEAITRKLSKTPQPDIDAASAELRQRIRDSAGDDPPIG